MKKLLIILLFILLNLPINVYAARIEQKTGGGGLGTVEGTAVLSTGETGGNKYLREDGDGTSSWQVVAGGAHDALTLSVGAETMLSLSTQELQLDSALGDTEIFVGTGAGTGGWVAMSGDATMANTGAVTVSTAAACSGTSAVATKVTITDNESTAENNPLVFVENGDLDGGNLGLESDGTCYYTPSTGVITTTGFAGALTGNVTGNVSGSSGSCTGNSATASTATEVTVTDNESTAENDLILFAANAEGGTNPCGVESDGDLYYTPSTGVVTATGFAGALTGNVTGNCSGTSATFTGNLSGEVTSVAMTTTIADSVAVASWNLTTPTITTNFTFDGVTATAIVTEAEGIAGSDNDTSIPTSAAVKDYADSNDADTTYTAGTAMDLSGTTFNFDATELEAVTWGAADGASITWTWNLVANDPSMTFGPASISINNTLITGGTIADADDMVFECDYDNDGSNKYSFTDGASAEIASITEAGVLTIASDLTVTGGDITLGTSAIFSGGDTTSLNLIDAIDATTETTLESALDIDGEVSSTGMGSTVLDETGIVLTSITIGALLGVDSIDTTGAADMDYGSADVTDHTFTSDGGTVILDGTVNSSTLTASEIVITDGSKNLVSAAVATYPSLTELSYVKGLSSAIQTQINGKQATVTEGSLADSVIVSADIKDGEIAGGDLATNIAITTTGLTTFNGDIQLGETDIKLDAALSGDEKWSGITISGTAGATIAVGDICYLNADDSRWELADANLSDGYDKLLGICVLAGNDGDATEMLVYGKVRSAAFPAFTVGSPLYLSETAGDITHTAPTTTDAATRIVGIAVTAEDMLFNPSNDYYTHT